MAKQLVYQFDLGGQTRTLNFGWYCWELFCEKMDIEPENFAKIFQGPQTFRAMRMVVFCGIAADNFLNEKPVLVTELDTAKWLNESPEVIDIIFKTALATFMGIKRDDIPKSEKKNPSRSGKSKKSRSVD